MELGGRESNHDRALSLREKGNNIKSIASGEAPLVLKVSANWRKIFKSWFGFSIVRPANCLCCTSCNREGLSSKLLAGMFGFTILELGSSLDGWEKSLRGLWFGSSAITLLIL